MTSPNITTFLQYVTQQRDCIVRHTNEREQIEKSLNEFKTRQCTDISEQVQTRRQIKLLSDKYNNTIHPMSVNQFDCIVKPYINYYYNSRHTDAFQSEQVYIDMFKKNIYPQTSKPQVVCVDTDICTECGGECVNCTDESAMYCKQCGYTAYYLDSNSHTMAYGDTVDYTSFSYKRINHLNEWLNHFQAKEATPIPDDILHTVMTYLKENRIVDVQFNHVKKALTSVCSRKYYDQAMQIWCRITNRKPLRLDPVCEEKIKLMFFRIQAPFEKHRPSGRCNFLSYPYVMYKFCQLLHYEHLLPFLSLLKGKRKLHMQESIFKSICDDLGWEFVPIQSHDLNGVNIDGNILNQIK